MKQFSGITRIALLAVTCTVIVVPSLDAASGPQIRMPSVESDAILSANGAKALDPSIRANKMCEDMFISCNTTVDSLLESADCEIPSDGSRIDFWLFDGDPGMEVTIDMTSDEFDTYLFLITPGPPFMDFGQDDDGGTGTNSRLVRTLDQGGEWAIGANGFNASELGNYTLSLQCSGGSQGVPAAPTNLVATTLSDTEIQLGWNDNSNDESEFRVEVRAPGGSFVDIGAVPTNTILVDVINLDPATTYDFRVRARNTSGNSGYSNTATATTQGTSSVCTASDTNICLLDGRFRVEVTWENFEGTTGDGMVVPFGSADSGLFWFFAADNWEMLVKMVDTCGSPFNTFWVFAAATTNVEYTLTVTDTQTGVIKSYFNPLGTAAPAIVDTEAFATCP